MLLAFRLSAISFQFASTRQTRLLGVSFRSFRTLRTLSKAGTALQTSGLVKLENARPRWRRGLANSRTNAAGIILSRLEPYARLARLDKPIGTLLLYYPCTWGILMGSFAAGIPPVQCAKQLVLFGVGAFVMRGAGCTINDLWDRDLDKSVERTKSRPLASGELSVPQAIGFLAVQLCAGLLVLTQLNLYSILLGASSMVLVVVYPVMKRYTHWPQAVLGMAFNWGTLLGYSAVVGAVDWVTCIPLYIGSVCWTLVYDTIYAHQDKHDDEPAGIRSTALLFKDKTPLVLSLFTAGYSSLLATAAVLNHQGPVAFGAVALSAVDLLRTIHTTDYEDRQSCWRSFVRCGRAGLLVTVGLGVDYWILSAGLSQ